LTTNGVIHQQSSSDSETPFWEDCWQQQTDLQDLSRTTENLGTCLKHKLYLNLAEHAEQQCIDVGDGVQFLASEEESALSPRDLFPDGMS